MGANGPLTMTHTKLRALVEVRARVGYEVRGAGNNWTLVVHAGRRETVLSSSRGEPRLFRRLETLVGYLKSLEVTQFRVDASEFSPSQPRGAWPDRRSIVASDRMRRAHRALAHDSAALTSKRAEK